MAQRADLTASRPSLASHPAPRQVLELLVKDSHLTGRTEVGRAAIRLADVVRALVAAVSRQGEREWERTGPDRGWHVEAKHAGLEGPDI